MLIKWGGQEQMIAVDADSTTDSQHLMDLLSFERNDNNPPWEGKLVVKPKIKKIIIELRRYISGANVWLYITAPRVDRYGNKKIASMSMNGKADWSAAELLELNLVIKEAEIVYLNAFTRYITNKEKLPKSATN